MIGGAFEQNGAGKEKNKTKKSGEGAGGAGGEKGFQEVHVT